MARPQSGDGPVSAAGGVIVADAELPDAQTDMLGMEGSPTKVVKVYTPPKREGAVTMIEGDTVSERASRLADALIAEKVV